MSSKEILQQHQIYAQHADIYTGKVCPPQPRLTCRSTSSDPQKHPHKNPTYHAPTMTSPPNPPLPELYPYLSYETSQHHPDFQSARVKSLLSLPEVTLTPDIPSEWTPENIRQNAFFNITLSHSTGVKARLSFTRPALSPDSAREKEHCCLLSLGTGLDGMVGRVHGGFSSVMMDQILGTCAASNVPVPEGWAPPATATMTVDYRAPVRSDSIVLARAWMLKESSGRKIWVRGALEDLDGKVLASGKALFVNPRGPGTAVL